MALKNSEGTGSHFPFFPAVRCVSVSYVILLLLCFSARDFQGTDFSSKADMIRITVPGVTEKIKNIFELFVILHV